MTRKRSNANAEPEPNAGAPITGVAAGGLGTAANLDDTQVLRTEDLQAAAAASPGWLDDEAAPAPSAPDLIPPDELALLQTAQNQTPVPPPPAPSVAERRVPKADHAAPPAAQAARPAEDATPTATGAPTAAVTASRPSLSRRNAPALAGVVAFVVLLLIAGSGFLSQLDLGIGAGPAGPAATAGALVEAAPSPSAEPRKDAGKGGGGGKCHGRGHGNDCHGGD